MKIWYAGNIDQLRRSAPLLIGQLKTETDGLTELGSRVIDLGKIWKYKLVLQYRPGAIISCVKSYISEVY